MKHVNMLFVAVVLHIFSTESHAMQQQLSEDIAFTQYDFYNAVAAYTHDHSPENFDRLAEMLFSDQGRALNLINRVLNDGTQETLLHRFVWLGGFLSARWVLDTGIFTEINKTDVRGKTALYATAQVYQGCGTEIEATNAIDMIEYLLTCGADVLILGMTCSYSSYLSWFSGHLSWISLLSLFLHYRDWPAVVIEEAYVSARYHGNVDGVELLEQYRRPLVTQNESRLIAPLALFPSSGPWGALTQEASGAATDREYADLEKVLNDIIGKPREV